MNRTTRIAALLAFVLFVPAAVAQEQAGGAPAPAAAANAPVASGAADASAAPHAPADAPNAAGAAEASASPNVAAAPRDPEAALTNDEVVKLAKLGLGDQVIVAKIKQAPRVDFRLDADSLGRLRQDGVGADAITAMLERSSAGAAPPATIVVSPGTGVGPSTPMIFSEGMVRMRTKDWEKDLRSSAGSVSTTYAFVTVLLFSDFSGLAAPVRTTDPRPSFLVAARQSPVGRYFLVRAKPNKGDRNRSVKMGRAGFVTYKEVGAPDVDWQIPADVVEEQPGLWRMTPKRPLPKGEYGVWVKTNDLFDFAVD